MGKKKCDHIDCNIGRCNTTNEPICGCCGSYIEQIRQHEWFYHPVKQFDQQLCPHCACKRKHDENGGYVYQEQGGADWGPIKPACITRTTGKEAGKV